MGEMRNAYKVFVGKPDRQRLLGTDVDGKITLR
jgi:hypothetical protein